MTTVKEYIKTLLKLAINNNPEVLKVIRKSKAVVQNFDPNQPRVPKGNPNGGQFAGSNKSHYASYNDFVNEFSDYIEDVPEDYEISDVEEALKDLGITKDKPLKISNSYETVNVTCESIRHIVGGGGDGHEPDTSRYKSINKMLATLKDPNLITEDENGKKRYFKLFDDKNKVKHQFVILFDENDIPTVYTTMPVNKDKKYFLNQVNAGKPVYKKGQTGVIKNSAADIIITDNQEDFNPDMKKHEVVNDKWITIKPHGKDSDDYRRIKLEDGETPKEAIERVYGKRNNKKQEPDQQYSFESKKVVVPYSEYKNKWESGNKYYSKGDYNPKDKTIELSRPWFAEEFEKTFDNISKEVKEINQEFEKNKDEAIKSDKWEELAEETRKKLKNLKKHKNRHGNQ